MPPGFDPYHKWLGIPPEDQPPNHYRLLAVRLFESDPDVIESAADQRMAHLRTHQAGQHSALSQKLLNEVAAAKVCLLNPEKKARYDESLRREAAAKARFEPPPVPSAPMPPASPPVATTPFAYPKPRLPVAPAISQPPVARPIPPMPLPFGGASSGAPPGSFVPPIPRAPIAAAPVPVANPVPPISVAPPVAPAAKGQEFDLESLGMGEDQLAGASGVRSRAAGQRTVAVDEYEGPSASPGAEVRRKRAARSQRNMVMAAIAIGAFLVALMVGLGIYSRSSSLSPGDADNPLGGSKETASPAKPPPADQPAAKPPRPVGSLSDSDLAELARVFPPGTSIATSSFVERNPISQGLVLHMNFEPNTVVDRDGKIFVRDLSGAGNHGMGEGLRRVTDTRFGSAIESEGGSLRLAKGLINKQREFTIAAWVHYAQRRKAWWMNEYGNLLMFGIDSSGAKIDDSSPAAIVQAFNSHDSEHRKISRFGNASRASPDWEFIAVRRQSAPDGTGALTVMTNDVSYVPDRSFPMVWGDFDSYTTLGGGQGIRLGEVLVFHRWLTKNEVQMLRRSRRIAAVSTPSEPVVTAPSSEPGRAAPDSPAPDSPAPDATASDPTASGRHVPAMNTAEPAPTKVESPEKSGTSETAATRLPVPDEVAQAKAVQALHEVYKENLAAAKSRDAMSLLSKEMLRKADESENDPAGRFALLDRARSLAIAGGDAGAALQAIDEIAKHFNVAAAPLKANSLTAILKLTGQPPDQIEADAESALVVMDELATADAYDTAVQLGNLTSSRFRHSTDPSLVRRVAMRTRLLRERQQDYTRFQKAQETLKLKPDDPDANLAAGRFLGVDKGQWESGLPLLAKGSDAVLKEAARREQAKPSATDAQLKLAELWYDRAEREPAISAKLAFQERAKHWYEIVQPNLNGAERTRAETRVGLIDRASADAQEGLRPSITRRP